MTTERDFDRIAMAWLADGPTELPIACSMPPSTRST